MTAETKLGAKHCLFFKGTQISDHVSIPVIGVHKTAPVIPAYVGLCGNAKKIEILAVDKLTAFQPIHPEQHRRTVGEGLEALFALTHGCLSTLALGDIIEENRNAIPKWKDTVLEPAIPWRIIIFEFDGSLSLQRAQVGLSKRGVFVLGILIPIIFADQVFGPAIQ